MSSHADLVYGITQGAAAQDGNDGEIQSPVRRTEFALVRMRTTQTKAP